MGGARPEAELVSSLNHSQRRGLVTLLVGQQLPEACLSVASFSELRLACNQNFFSVSICLFCLPPPPFLQPWNSNTRRLVSLVHLLFNVLQSPFLQYQTLHLSHLALHEGDRKFRMQCVQSGDLQRQLFKDSVARLLHRPHWREFPHVEHMASDTFRVSLRTIGAAHAMMWKFEGYPYKLIELLCNDEEELDVNILCLMSAPLCCLDRFTVSFRASFPTHQALRSQEARAMLRALFLCFDGSIFSTERLHSANARRVAARTWTHQLRLSQAALGQVGSATPAFACDFTTPNVIAKRKVEDAMLSDAQDDHPPKKKKGEEEESGVLSCTTLHRLMGGKI